MTNQPRPRADRPITRRRLVAVSGTALAVGLAGCTEIGLGGGESGEGGEQEGGEGGGEQGGGEGDREQEGGGGDQEDGGGEQEDG